MALDKATALQRVKDMWKKSELEFFLLCERVVTGEPGAREDLSYGLLDLHDFSARIKLDDVLEAADRLVD